MKAPHLTDEEIQAFALENSAVDMAAREHVSTCEECKARVADYQLLFTALKEQPKPSFDFDLSELVMAKLPKPVVAPDNSFIYVFALAAITLTGAVIYYFRAYFASLFTGITPLLIYLTAVTVTTIVIILSTDMYKNYHRKMRALDFY